MKTCYGFSKYKVEMFNDNPSIQTWVDEYLCPFFCVKNKDYNETWKLEVVSNGEALQKITDIFKDFSAINDVMTFSELATSFVANHAHSCYVVMQQDYDTMLSTWWYLIDRMGKNVILWIEENQLEARYTIGRIIRSLIMGMAVEDGWNILHASCVETKNGGFISIGNKGSGKTAAMLALLQIEGSKYIANDKLLVKNENGSLIAQGLPYSPAVKQIALERLELGTESSYIFQGTKDKVRFLVKDFCSLLHVSIVPATIIHSIIVPQYSTSSEISLGDCNDTILNNAILSTICNFQPVWDMIFNKRNYEKTWWKNVPIYSLKYNDETIEQMIREVVYAD